MNDQQYVESRATTLTDGLAGLLPEAIDYVVALPDSISSPLIKQVQRHPAITYLQVVHESQAVGLAAGLTLAGRVPIVLMENSGLRAAAESLARLVVLHQIHMVVVVSHRGGFGDPNWWAQYHARHAEDVIKMFGFSYVRVARMESIKQNVADALAQVRTRTNSAVVALEPSALNGL